MKLMKILVAALVLAAMVSPAFAEDRLSLSGEMRARAFHADDDSAHTKTWADQRLRIAGKIAVAEGVSVTFRTDITEGTNWGNSATFAGTTGPIRSNGFGHARSGAQQQWDRAHLDITKGGMHLRAGQQYVGTGGAFAIDTQDSGLALDLKAGAVDLKLFSLVDNDGGSRTLADSYLSGVIAGFKAGAVAGKAYAAAQSNGADDIAYVVGAHATTDMGGVKVFGELDFFTGENNGDVMGTQAVVDASMAAGAATVGVQGMFALGADSNEDQLVVLGNGFNGWDPVFDVGTSLHAEDIALQGGGANRVFDWTLKNAGVVGARIYAKTEMGAMKVGASAAYLTTEDDDRSDADTLALAAGLVYPILDNTTFQLQLQYQDGEVDNVDRKLLQAGTGLFVKF